jgi:hypothetical protein
LNASKTNPDEDLFIAVPKSGFSKTARAATKTKDTFSPDEIEVGAT